jgi:hypothetical protein
MGAVLGVMTDRYVKERAWLRNIYESNGAGIDAGMNREPKRERCGAETRFRFIRMGRSWECSEKEALAISAFEWPWGAPRLLLV